MAAAGRAALAVTDASLYETDGWWDDSVRGLRQLRKLVPGRLAYFDGVIADWGRRDVLDLGCGGGFMAEALARRDAGVIGIDPCAPAIAAAVAHADQAGLDIDYRVGRGETLPLASGSRDIVVCVDVLEHVASLDAVLGEIYRVLAPGGLLLFDTINRTRLAGFVMVTMAERVLRLLPRGTHDPGAFIAPDVLRSKLEALGFDVSPFVGFGPRGIDRDLDFTFGTLPTRAILYLGHARRAS